MGTYLSKPVTDKISQDMENDRILCGASSMQGWRESQEVMSYNVSLSCQTTCRLFRFLLILCHCSSLFLQLYSKGYYRFIGVYFLFLYPRVYFTIYTEYKKLCLWTYGIATIANTIVFDIFWLNIFLYLGFTQLYTELWSKGITFCCLRWAWWCWSSSICLKQITINDQKQILQKSWIWKCSKDGLFGLWWQFTWAVCSRWVDFSSRTISWGW